jgi:hypothetical protein
MDTIDLEVSREKSEAVAKQQDGPKKEVMVEIVGTLVEKYGDWHLAIGVPAAEEMDPGQWWALAEVGHSPRIVDPLCHSCIAQRTRSSGTRQDSVV